MVDHSGDLKEHPKDFHEPFDEETAMNILHVSMGVFGGVAGQIHITPVADDAVGHYQEYIRILP